MSIEPIRDQIAVTKQEAATQTASGLYVPTTVDEKVVVGVVKAVGTGRIALNGVEVPLVIKVGDKVKFNRSLATEVSHDGETVLIIREEQILCRLT